MPPEVKNCAVQECYYNLSEICHAEAIQVGSQHPQCDTFITVKNIHGEPADQGMVGACHQFNCKFNTQLACHAGSVNVDYHESHADCVTYDPLPSLEGDPEQRLASQSREIIPEGSTAFRLSGLP